MAAEKLLESVQDPMLAFSWPLQRSLENGCNHCQFRRLAFAWTIYSTVPSVWWWASGCGLPSSDRTPATTVVPKWTALPPMASVVAGVRVATIIKPQSTIFFSMQCPQPRFLFTWSQLAFFNRMASDQMVSQWSSGREGIFWAGM